MMAPISRKPELAKRFRAGFSGLEKKSGKFYRGNIQTAMMMKAGMKLTTFAQKRTKRKKGEKKERGECQRA